MSDQHRILKGTFFLTFCGLFCRLIGFFFRIFLSRTLGAEKMGLYQLVFPIFGICFSLCCGAYQTALSKLYAEKTSSQKPDLLSPVFLTAFSLALGSAILCSFLLATFSGPIAKFFLLEPRCGDLLFWLGFSLPFAAVNSCFHGYYLGISKMILPGLVQVIEQIFRSGYVLLLWFILQKTHSSREITALTIVISMMIGEMTASITYLFCQLHKCRSRKRSLPSGMELFNAGKQLSLLVFPLIGTRLILHLLQSLENILVPNRLKAFGLVPSEALSVFGILSAMVLPFLFFPGTITNSLNMVLLPEIAKANACKNRIIFQRLARKSISFSFLLGLLTGLFFFFFGKILGSMVFHEPRAGEYLKYLSVMCPFLYLSTTLTSILNGLGEVKIIFRHSCVVCLTCIGIIFFVIPIFGIKAYLFEMITEQLLNVSLNFHYLQKKYDLIQTRQFSSI